MKNALVFTSLIFTCLAFYFACQSDNSTSMEKKIEEYANETDLKKRDSLRTELDKSYGMSSILDEDSMRKTLQEIPDFKSFKMVNVNVKTDEIPANADYQLFIYTHKNLVINYNYTLDNNRKLSLTIFNLGYFTKWGRFIEWGKYKKIFEKDSHSELSKILFKPILNYTIWKSPVPVKELGSGKIAADGLFLLHDNRNSSLQLLSLQQYQPA